MHKHRGATAHAPGARSTTASTAAATATSAATLNENATRKAASVPGVQHSPAIASSRRGRWIATGAGGALAFCV
jgi:hypothetical protein